MLSISGLQNVNIFRSEGREACGHCAHFVEVLSRLFQFVAWLLVNLGRSYMYINFEWLLLFKHTGLSIIRYAF
jgi:hypothetical protein